MIMLGMKRRRFMCGLIAPGAAITYAAVNGAWMQARRDSRADANPASRGRLRKAEELLRTARTGLTLQENNDRIYAWCNRATRHIDGALEHVPRAFAEADREREPGW